MTSKNKMIFISGSGRSGTHLIGRSISSHKDIMGRIETKNTFNLITKIATEQGFKPKWKTYYLKLKLVKELRSILKSSDCQVLEKSHPSLWLMDFLVKKINSKFILVYRDVEPTVSSMLEHPGVLSWYDKLPLDSPNRFLGINSDNAQLFENYSLEEKCALRWKSHYEKIFDLKQKYPKETFIINYDEFLKNPEPTFHALSVFLDIDNTFDPEPFKIDSLDKWKKKLDDQQIKRINKVTQ